ncbi:SDR family NAD(P)-dependent oxidoreductase [Streptomyces sp. NBC_01604]|uniref:SDR family NAD(P)-dependent oxidoreductase n=1 Tax=Streptomyces sp. NBC_01604 TaxID=2975894 RepID=UPI0038695D1A
MTDPLDGTVEGVTGASSGIGAATARALAAHGAAVALVARRKNRLDDLVAQIGQTGGTALAVQADITGRAQAQAAVQQTVDGQGRLDTLVNNAGLMLIGPAVGADTWDRMIKINLQGPLHTTHAALPHLLQAAEQDPRHVADIVNISSVAGRRAGNGYAVYNLTKFGVNGFTESLRQELTQRHVRVGVIEPGDVATELGRSGRSSRSPWSRACSPSRGRSRPATPRPARLPLPKGWNRHQLTYDPLRTAAGRRASPGR